MFRSAGEQGTLLTSGEDKVCLISAWFLSLPKCLLSTRNWCAAANRQKEASGALGRVALHNDRNRRVAIGRSCFVNMQPEPLGNGLSASLCYVDSQKSRS